MEADVLTRRVDRMCLIVLCLGLGFLGPVAAQDTPNTPAAADYESYRGELLRFLDMFEEVAVHYQDGYRREQLALARRMLERVRPEDFAQAFPEGPRTSPAAQRYRGSPLRAHRCPASRGSRNPGPAAPDTAGPSSHPGCMQWHRTRLHDQLRAAGGTAGRRGTDLRGRPWL
jgi:hypothetical protein